MSSSREPLKKAGQEKDGERLISLYTQGFHNPGRMAYNLTKFAPVDQQRTETLKELSNLGAHNPGRMTYDLSKFAPKR